MAELLVIVEWTVQREGMETVEKDVRQYVSVPLFLAVPSGATGLRLKLYQSVDIE